MIGNPDAPARAGHVPALDVFRGLAALLMVVNHLGFWVLTPAAATHGASGALVFLGSFAPVLFFFAVGFGAGLAPSAGPLHARLDKALLLIAADQLMFWAGGVPAGLDFFGFIALSMLVVWAVQRSARPVVFAVVLICLVFLGRYALTGPLPGEMESSPVARWLLGRPVKHVSYPAAPWLIFPLLGFLLALGWRRTHSRPGTRAWAAVAAGAATCMLAALVLAYRGAPFFRWGMVSAGFFVLAVGVAMTSVLAAVAAHRYAPRLASMLSLSGVASFAVVPIHHALIHTGVLPRDTTSVLGFIVLAAAAVAAAFALSHAFERGLKRFWPSRPGARPLVFAALAVGVLAATTFLLGARGAVDAGNLTAAAAQLVLVAFFAWRVGPLSSWMPSRRRKAAVAARSG